ncbi:MAG: hypothetical protein DMF49_04735 [Acidobacteria bacterium]|nr:MAG: hypothetical protein DMF49_04735 [Acidobacteriota bacterium]
MGGFKVSEIISRQVSSRAELASPAEELGIYYQVYNLMEQEGGPSFDVTYRLFLRSGTEEHPIGKPIVRSGLTEPVQGWSFPLEKGPSGSYRLEVTVDDHGSQASGSLDFEVL